MKKQTFLIAAFLVAIFSQTALSQTNYKTYSNARFDYSISYPSNLLAPQGEADNGDGQIFSGDGAEMRVYGSNMLANETLLKEFNSVMKEYGSGVTYRTYRKNFFVISALRDGKIFYRKTIARPNGSFITFTIEYDESKRGVYDKAVSKMAKSFK
ncbi:MAG TPA: hypothetical protein VF556_10435 [Pyrinomonadaceae bacterium]|jgi:hypothetical protein